MAATSASAYLPACQRRRCRAAYIHCIYNSTLPASSPRLPPAGCCTPWSDPNAHVCCAARTGVVRYGTCLEHAAGGSNPRATTLSSRWHVHPRANLVGVGTLAMPPYVLHNTRLSVRLPLASACRCAGRRRSLDFRV